MVNQSQKNDERFWKKWKASGAVENGYAAYKRSVAVKPEHRPILDKIRSLYVESGGKPLYTPDDFGLNTFYKSKSGALEIDFDYGVPHSLFTPIGSYTILGSNVVGNTKKFWDLLVQEFNVEIIKPQRDDSKFKSCNDLEYQLCASGPFIKISEKKQ